MSEEYPSPIPVQNPAQPPALPTAQAPGLPPAMPPAPPPAAPPKSKNPVVIVLMVVGFIFGGIVIISILAGIAVPVLSKTRKKANLSEAISNAKQIGHALMCFDSEYDSFPSDETAAKIREKNNTDIPLGNSSSNDYMRQLFVGNYVYGERTFYAKIPNIHKPDEVTTGTRCLAAGECAFTYVYGISSKGDAATPILVTPMIPHTTKFDPQPFDRKAVVLHLDQSVSMEPIDRNGHVIVNGMGIFDPGQPYWHGKTPDLRYPAYP